MVTYIPRLPHLPRLPHAPSSRRTVMDGVILPTVPDFQPQKYARLPVEIIDVDECDGDTKAGRPVSSSSRKARTEITLIGPPCSAHPRRSKASKINSIRPVASDDSTRLTTGPNLGLLSPAVSLSEAERCSPLAKVESIAPASKSETREVNGLDEAASEDAGPSIRRRDSSSSLSSQSMSSDDDGLQSSESRHTLQPEIQTGAVPVADRPTSNGRSAAQLTPTAFLAKLINVS